MLTRTTELGLAVLSQLASRHPGEGPQSVRLLAEALHSSPSYSTKVISLLTRARITKSYRGAPGGVELARDPASITLFEVVEVCQGKLLAEYCELPPAGVRICAFHAAMSDVHQSLAEALGRWTISDLLADQPYRCSRNCLTSLAATGRSLHNPGGPLPVPGGGAQ